MQHKPVLLQETLQWLNLKSGAIVLDGTLGSGGHALEILKVIGPRGRLIGIDQDPSALERTRQTLAAFQGQISLHCDNFRNVEHVLDRVNLPAVNAVILDVGLSSDQLEDESRGFSFSRSGPLDMRMNPENEQTARDLVNDLSKQQLEKIFREYGEEHRARRVVDWIDSERRKKPIETTVELVKIVEKAIPYRGRLHPATKVFQALRIATNDELGALKEGLAAIWKRLSGGGRLAVISFHSLEDRIVKWQFREWQAAGTGTIVTKKPVIATREEICENPRSRSAKLRVMEKS